MQKDLSEVPGYARDIVLVGWPVDETPRLHPHRVTLLNAGLHSILAHEEEILKADLLVFYPRNDLLRAPATEAEFAAVGAFCRHSEIAKPILSRKPGITDTALGRRLVASNWADLLEAGLSAWPDLLTTQHSGQVFGANCIFFLPEDMDASDTSPWKRWFGVPQSDRDPVTLNESRIDSHIVSQLYYASLVKMTIAVSDRSELATQGKPFTPEELSAGFYGALKQRLSTLSQHGLLLPSAYKQTPLIFQDGGLADALSQQLEIPCTVSTSMTEPLGAAPSTPHAEACPVVAIEHFPWTDARIRMGMRNVFLLRYLPNAASFLEEVATYLYRYGLSTSASDATIAAALAGTWARGKVESRLGHQSPIVGESAGILGIYPRLLESVYHPKDSILIYGPIGAGKEVVFDTLTLLTPGQNLRVIDVTGFESNSMISNLFGHEPGSYTGATHLRKGAVESIGHGTLIIDNFQNVSKEAQAKLLRLLEKKGEYQRFGGDQILRSKARIAIALNREPQALVKEGALLPDLISRFPIAITIPPLNDRRVDIPLLVDAFYQECMKEEQWDTTYGDQLTIAPIIKQLMLHDWSEAAGNVRGLRNQVLSMIRSARMALLSNAEEAGEIDHISPVHIQTGAANRRAGQDNRTTQPRIPRGRKPGRDIQDDALHGIIVEATTDRNDTTRSAPMRNLEWVFDQVDLKRRTGSKKIKRTPRALSARVARIADQRQRTDCIQRLVHILGNRE